MGDQKNMLSRSVMRMTRQWSIVLLTIGAWLLISNHCVLGLGDTTADSDSKSGGCPMHSAPAKEKPAANLPCCKDLHAIAPHAVKNLTTGASQLEGVPDYVAAIIFVPSRLTTQLLALETGPPPWISFAESILQRSILAHAPPAGFPRL
jgi:hypothetical protein